MSTPKPRSSGNLKGDYLKTFESMVYARSFEEKMAALYRAGKIVGGVYLGRGQEAFSGAMGTQLNQSTGDIFGALIRDQAGRYAFGEPLINAARTYLGSVKGPMKGRDGNIHRGLPLEGLPAMISHLGSLIAVVNGMLIAKRFKGQTGVVGAASIGDGGTSTGSFHEALNQAAVEKLPLVLAVANNQYAYSTDTEHQYACDDLADRSRGYGVRGYSIDGTDPMECLETFSEAVERARTGEGPQMVVGKLLRLAGHGEHDDASYVTKALKEGHHGRDCMDVAKSQLVEKSWMSAKEIGEMEERIQTDVEGIVSKAQGEPSPNPLKDDWRPLASTHLIEGHNIWRD